MRLGAKDRIMARIRAHRSNMSASPLPELRLVNCTSHPQDSAQWSPLGIKFISSPLASVIDENAPLHSSVMSIWRDVLASLSTQIQIGQPAHGVMLAGYLPTCLGIAQQLRDSRHACYVSVMGISPTPSPEGKKVFVPSGVRLIAPHPFVIDPLPEYRGEPRIEGLIHVSSRPLDEQRRALVQPMCLYPLYSHPPILPPPVGEDLTKYCEEISEVVDLCESNRWGVVYDGPPIETALRLYHMIRELHPRWPLYFLRTQKTGATTFAAPVACERLPY